MKNTLKKLFNYELLSYQEAKDSLLQISAGQSNDAENVAFMTAFQLRDISVEELSGFRDALLQLCIRPNLVVDDAIDLCGTGGDGKDSFNISTLTAVLLGSMGYKVVKHGNYGVSSLCGSSNVLEALGYQFSNESAILQKQLDESNICFLHAPLFHPAMKAIAPMRKALGMRTFFNLLGPLVNPVQPNLQLLGVADLKVMRLYQYLLQQSARKDFAIVHSLDGFDEISLTSQFKCIRKGEEQLLSPAVFELKKLQEEEIKSGDSIDAAAELFMQVLEGKGTPAQQQVVAANAAAAIQLFEPNKSLLTCYQEALNALQSGCAAPHFLELTAISQRSFKAELINN